nr:hypothetical protein [uncultured Campylobacter sp.]
MAKIKFKAEFVVILAQYRRSKERSRALCRGSINKMPQRSGLNLNAVLL